MENLQSRELRIGNLVMDNAKVKIVTSGMISNWDIIKRDYGGYNPIPLTEEWLLRFGFNSNNHEIHETYFINISLIERYDFENFLTILVMDDCCYVDVTEKEIHPDTMSYRVTLKDINHVHQLQNLYFALTGEELKLQTND